MARQIDEKVKEKWIVHVQSCRDKSKNDHSSSKMDKWDISCMNKCTTYVYYSPDNKPICVWMNVSVQFFYMLCGILQKSRDFIFCKSIIVTHTKNVCIIDNSDIK
jgi:hypothetical protein